jgi:hypothetical protein
MPAVTSQHPVGNGLSIAIGNGFPVALGNDVGICVALGNNLGLIVALGNALGLLVAIGDDLSATSTSTSLLFCVVQRWKQPVFLLILLNSSRVECARTNLQVRKRTPATTAAATAATAATAE